MPRALPTCNQPTWNSTGAALLLGFICYALPWSVFAALPIPADNRSVLRIQGSNTIGATLGPALVRGLFEEQGLNAIHLEAGAVDNEQKVIGTTRDGRRVTVEVAAHGSGTGFSALQDGSTDLAASSRPIKASELSALAALGDLQSREAEQIIALDGLAIILHPGNPLGALRIDQLAQIFSGELQDWAQLGGNRGPIKLYARDDNSGTYDTFKELVLSAHETTLAASAQRFESSEALSDAVSQDPNGIGFIGLPYVRQAKAVAIAAGDSQAMRPSLNLIATEDYPLSRRLFLYNQPGLPNPWAKALVSFAHSPRGQAIVAHSGFIAQTVQAITIVPDSGMPETYQALAREAKRLSVNFRFQQGSAVLDNKALRDLERLLAYLKEQDKLRQKVVLVGFGDAKADPARAELLSKLRAMAVRRELARHGVVFREITGLGDELPVAVNDAEDGRIKNRRVEVWVY
ncbi:phosphate ABC transporter substrate-binding/OmpA family protein [Pseudomonas sp. sp1636]|uniref:phosphate ABC transporter substrate-binding/OmpA family protein n=1 Tax=Pseudomonas sp. sp1636 TaxID=3036707 RepID=UPI0025A611CA|nr:phosphate ABC transporter substrate-binding/OmpA family protein [Pseudomonas sp. sp1636]MDM8350236.1 phosphate ABC transporter substrate-binding/OmpA family protein [Pseudomonas sp. sp1636]